MGIDSLKAEGERPAMRLLSLRFFLPVTTLLKSDGAAKMRSERS